MMRFLVLSDSHRNRFNIASAVKRMPDCDAILFLGDGIGDFDDTNRFDSHPLWCVRGNCDMFSFFNNSSENIPEELILHFEEYTVMMMHGHRFGVKSSLEHAIIYASNANADILLFGHTHTPFEKYLPEGKKIGDITLSKPLYLFNPGSIGQMNSGSYSFGTMTLTSKGVLFGHGKL